MGPGWLHRGWPVQCTGLSGGLGSVLWGCHWHSASFLNMGLVWHASLWITLSVLPGQSFLDNTMSLFAFLLLNPVTVSICLYLYLYNVFVLENKVRIVLGNQTSFFRSRWWWCCSHRSPNGKGWGLEAWPLSPEEPLAWVTEQAPLSGLREHQAAERFHQGLEATEQTQVSPLNSRKSEEPWAAGVFLVFYLRRSVYSYTYFLNEPDQDRVLPSARERVLASTAVKRATEEMWAE